MKKSTIKLLSFGLVLMALAGPLPAQSASQSQKIDTGSSSLFGIATTTTQRAVFAVFLGSGGGFDTAISVSNILAAPPRVSEVLDNFSDREGTLEFYLWNGDGQMTFYATSQTSPGVGLGLGGTLAPGQTYRVLLSDILDAAGFAEESFFGYGWLVANFDGVQGTANVTDFATFTQTTVLQPDLGTTFFDFDANAGVPLQPPGN